MAGLLVLWSWGVLLLGSVGGISRSDLLRSSSSSQEVLLEPGTNGSSKVDLDSPVYFMGEVLKTVYIHTNGFISAEEPPGEASYVGQMPASFNMLAVLLGDLEVRAGRGEVSFWQTGGPDVLGPVGRTLDQAFPARSREVLKHALVVTWHNVTAHGGGIKSNTFQLVVASSSASSYAILLYPRDGLQFLSTPLGGRSVALEAGFNQGQQKSWWGYVSPGEYYRLTTEEESSVSALAQKSNAGRAGVWAFQVGKYYFTDILPGVANITGPEEEAQNTTPAETQDPQTPEPWNPEPEETQTPEPWNPEPEETQTPEPWNPEPEETQTPEPWYPEPEETQTPEPWYPEPQETQTPEPWYPEPEETQTPEPWNPEPEETQTPEPWYPEPEETQTPEPWNPEPEETQTPEPWYAEPEETQTPEPWYPEPEETQTPEPWYPEPEETQTPEPWYAEPEETQTPEPWYPEPEETQTPEPWNPEPEETQTPEPWYPEPDDPEDPERSRSQQREVVVLDGVDLDADVFSYNTETCSNTRLTCSTFADCHDYSTGPCCQCRPGFYGNGKDCVAEGKPQRMNGKVSGRVFVGDAPTAFQLRDNDLHSYVVANDGRAYVAISSVPEALGPALLPLTSLGGAMGWAFALEQPGYHNGFSLIGGVFSREVQVEFAGGERLSISQEFQGIDEHDHLLVSTSLEGRVPTLPPGATVNVQAYHEVYHHHHNLITSSSNREYSVTLPSGEVQARRYLWRQTLSFQSCVHGGGGGGAGGGAGRVGAVPWAQQLSVDQIFVMYDADNQLIRYAMSNRIGSLSSGPPEQNPCFTGRHGCDNNAVCRHGDGLQFTCECSAGFTGDGTSCYDVDECRSAPPPCGHGSVCTNQPGSFHCVCLDGFLPAEHNTCLREELPVDHCQTGSHDCDVTERATCHYTGGSAYLCSCLPGYQGDGRACQDVDECQKDGCHGDAVCFNTQGSYSCQCRPGFHGDGFYCSSVSTEPSSCERLRDSVAAGASGGFLAFFRPRPPAGQYVPQCEEGGAYRPTQCHPAAGQCWCVDAQGQEVPNTRTADTAPLCIDQAVAPPPVGPTPRPDVIPVAPGARLLFAQSGKMEQIPLEGGAMRKENTSTLLHIPDRVVIAVAFDCVDQTVYWSDITGPAISKASLSGGDITPVITQDLESPEGLAVDHVSRLLFWTDSVRDTVEVSRLDGSQRHLLFDTDLVNPRPIVTDPTYGRLYWADWDRDGPKIESANMDGSERTVLVKDNLALPNALTFDPEAQLLCWADAGTRRVECWDVGRGVRTLVVSGVQYPFGIAGYGRSLFYTDWRRVAVVAVDVTTGMETDDFLPQKRSQPYGIAVATTQCYQGYNYCFNNGGCPQLCLPRAGGSTCRCPSHGHAPC